MKQKLCRSANGLFVRNLGWKLAPGDRYVQHKFYLGRDEQKARLASLRLEQLWQQVCAYENRVYGVGDRPCWDDVTLAIAEAVRKGEPSVKVYPEFACDPPWVAGPGMKQWLAELQQDITVIKLELRPHSPSWPPEPALDLPDSNVDASPPHDVNAAPIGQRAGVRSALDSFSKWVLGKYVDLEKKPTAWALAQTRQIAFVKEHVPNYPLHDLTGEGVEELIDILRLRPVGARGKHVSVEFAQKCIKQLRRFLRWLTKSSEFAWKWPAGLELSRISIPKTPEEKSGTAHAFQVPTYTFDELKLLWAHATPLQRLFMLLALNCGFGRAEIASLGVAEVLLNSSHPHAKEVGCPGTTDDWIFRIRQKTGVYGEFKLWEETVRAIQWWKRERTKIRVPLDVATLLVNGCGHRYDKPTKSGHANGQISNSWYRLSENIKKRHPDFRKLSFKSLRKTAGNLIRSEATGEIAAVFLCHGQPVKADELLDLYTNRPFAKVFTALDAVGNLLRPLWTDITEAFPAC